MSNENIREWTGKLIELVEVLSASADRQIEYLEELGTSPQADELALELEDMLWVLDGAAEKDLIPPVFVENIRDINTMFDKMSASDDKSLWYIDSLGSRPAERKSP